MFSDRDRHIVVQCSVGGSDMKDDGMGWAITAMIVMCVAAAIGAFLGLVLSP